MSKGLPFLLSLTLLAFVAWAMTSTMYLLTAQRSIRDTTSLCTVKLTEGIAANSQYRGTIDDLKIQLTYMTARVEAFEQMLNVSRGGKWVDATGETPHGVGGQ